MSTVPTPSSFRRLALSLFLALGLGGPLAAAITYGGDATFSSTVTTSNTSVSLGLGSTGANAILFVMVESSVSFTSPTITYNGVTMNTIGVVGTYNGTVTLYRELFYVTNLANNKTLSITSGSTALDNGSGKPWNYLWFTYNGVNTSSPIGNKSVGNTYNASGNSWPTVTASFSFTPSASTSRIVELAMIQSGSNSWSNYGVGSGTNESSGGISMWSWAPGYGLSDYAPGSIAAFSVSQSMKPNWNATTIYGWAVELLQGSTNSPTYTPATTPSPTPTRTPTRTPTPPPGSPTFTTTVTPGSCFNSTPAFAVNCGGSSYTGGVTWAADQAYTAGNWGYTGGTPGSNANTITGGDPTLYHSNNAGAGLGYTFNLASGNYQVVLYFAETQYSASGSRVMSAYMNAVTLTSGLDVYAASGGKNIAHAVTGTVTVAAGVLTVNFTASVGAPMVDAIEIFPACGMMQTPTFSATPSPTFTPNPPIYQGLSPTTRLYGLEYIPFPPQGSGTTAFTSLDISFTSASTLLEKPKNTARWRIELVGLSLTVGADVASVETRIGPYGVTCTTGYLDANTQGNNYNLQMPDRPQDLSTTYAYLTASAVPITESYDVMGDPRYVPYLDMMHSGTTGFADNYNWFFRDLTTDSSGAWYTQYVPNAKFNDYNGQPNIDVPKAFMLIREGVMISRSIYTSVCGWSAYYIGGGGEIGGDSDNALTNAVPTYGGPWNSNSAPFYVDEIIGASTWVRNSAGWMSMPFIGELWPDNQYHSDWASNGTTGTSATWGNLRNILQGGNAYRDSIANFGKTYVASGNYSSTYPFVLVQHRNQGNGSATFMNSTDGSSTNPFNHSGLGSAYSAPVLPDGTSLGNDFNFAMPPTFAVTRPWALNLGGNTPQEWSMAPYNVSRPIINAYTGQPVAVATPGFYDYTGAENFSSAPIRMYDTGGVIDPRGVPSAGWFVVNGLAPSTQSGYSFVARFALLGCLRTFLDAGVPTVAASFTSGANRIGAAGPTFRIAPVPLVQITVPTNNQDMSHYSNITINWKERYARWDGYRYTDNYPCIDGPQSPDPNGNYCPQLTSQGGDPTKEWHDPEGLVFNVKYSTDQGATWTSCLTGANALAGVYLPGPDSIPYSPTYLYTSTWDVSSLPAGKKIVRVEVYRVDYPQHYGFHDIQITTQYP